MSKTLSNLPDDLISLTAASPLSINANNRVSISATPSFSSIALTSTADGAITSAGGLTASKFLQVSNTSDTAVSLVGGLTVGKNLNLSGFISQSITGSAATVPATFLQPSLSNGGFNCIQNGVSASNYNCARLYFNFVSSGSSSNSAGIGLWNGPQNVQVDGLGIVYLKSTTESTSTTIGGTVVAGGCAIAKTLHAQKFKSTSGTGYTVTTSFSTVYTMSEGEMGILQFLGGGTTFAIWHVTYSATNSIASAVVLGGSNMVAQFSGANVQIRSMSGSPAGTWSYIRFM